MWSSLLLLVSLAASQVVALGEKRVLVFPDSSVDQQISTEDQTVFSVFSSPSSSKNTDDLSSKTDTDDLFYLSSKSSDKATPLLLDSRDDIAIHLAAQTFAHDVYRVTGLKPDLYNDTLPSGVHHAVVVGSAGSKLIGGIHENEYVEQLELKGKWESYDVRVVERPLHGLDRGLVIVGSDRRGTIYALYTLSEQMGVSPFHYWADVPVRPKPSIAFTASQHLSHGEPSVKYRGLFINDEHPALWGWAEQKWKVKPGEPAFLPDMYRPWFEMMLRLKANYFWPAMYASMFDVDGMDTSNGFPMPAAPGPNQVLANQMGIVMGSSHHEPMARNKPEWDRGKQGPWDWTNSKFLTKWWTYGAERAKGMETLFTLGMRGDGDMPLTGASNKLVENITATQQNILKEVYETDDLSTVPQMWCMYKEVAEYYVNGLEVPEDVITLFADDNWGNIMTVQPPEKQHKAGSGIYYHVDYVGMPRAYKWINTINLAKTWEQMTIAHTFNTTSIWILNIGSLKPLELPTEHFLSLAWDIEAWPINSVETYLAQWAEREFGEAVKEEVAEIMMKYSMYASRRKAELVNSTTFSLVNYEEAERVLGAWEDLTERASKVHASLPDDTKPAFYEMVYGLCLMQTNLNKLYIAAERSNLYAEQARNAANLYAKEAVDAFFYDANLTETFHALLDRKWDHMLDQSHIGWNSHLEPMKDIMPPVSYVNPIVPARQGIPIPELSYGVTTSLRVTFENSRGSWPGNTVYNCPGGEHCTVPSLLRMDPYGSPSRWIDVGASGPRDTTFKVDSSDDWIIVEPKSGKIARDGTTDMRLRVTIDWSRVPENENSTGYIYFAGSDRSNVTIAVPVVKFDKPPSDFHGTVEGDGYVVIEAAHFTRNTSKHEYAFQEIKGYGRTLSGLEMFPRTTHNFTEGEGPSLEYDFYTYTTSDTEEAELDIQIGPTLNFLGNNKTLSFGVQVDGGDIRIINPIPTEPLGFAKERPDQTPVAIGAVPKDWIEIVKNEIRDIRIPISLGTNGKHTIKIFGMTTGIIIERVIVDLGGIKTRGYSYLGPPESVRV